MSNTEVKLIAYISRSHIAHLCSAGFCIASLNLASAMLQLSCSGLISLLLMFELVSLLSDIRLMPLRPCAFSVSSLAFCVKLFASLRCSLLLGISFSLSFLFFFLFLCLHFEHTEASFPASFVAFFSPLACASSFFLKYYKIITERYVHALLSV